VKLFDGFSQKLEAVYVTPLRLVSASMWLTLVDIKAFLSQTPNPPRKG